MKFTTRLADLIRQYTNNLKTQANDTIVLGPSKTLYAEHFLFRELDDNEIQTYLAPHWEEGFPEALTELLKVTNGAKLFNVRLNCGKVTITSSMLVLFGLPRTNPFQRPKDEEEPFDIRIENLDNRAPASWVKFGSYIPNFDFHCRRELFVDCITGEVFARQVEKSQVLAQWESIDSCLCDIIDSMKDCTYHYDY